jgi:small subunit ribosomal protein S20
VKILPNIKSAKKRVKVTAVKTLQNQMFKTNFKTTLKKFEKAAESGDKAAAEACYKEAVSKLDKAVSKGALHVNAAARKKSQFTKKLNAMK